MAEICVCCFRALTREGRLEIIADLVAERKKTYDLERQLARQTALPSLTKEEWGMVLEALDYCFGKSWWSQDWSDWTALRAKVREQAGK